MRANPNPDGHTWSTLEFNSTRVVQVCALIVFNIGSSSSLTYVHRDDGSVCQFLIGSVPCQFLIGSVPALSRCLCVPDDHDCENC